MRSDNGNIYRDYMDFQKVEWKDSAFHRAKKKNGVSALVYSIV